MFNGKGLLKPLLRSTTIPFSDETTSSPGGREESCAEVDRGLVSLPSITHGASSATLSGPSGQGGSQEGRRRRMSSGPYDYSTHPSVGPETEFCSFSQPPLRRSSSSAQLSRTHKPVTLFLAPGPGTEDGVRRRGPGRSREAERRRRRDAHCKGEEKGPEGERKWRTEDGRRKENGRTGERGAPSRGGSRSQLLKPCQYSHG